MDYPAGGFADVAEGMGHYNAHRGQLQPQQYPQSTPSTAADKNATAFYHQTLPNPGSCDIKPRLNKEQHDYLENHYQQVAKPLTSVKKEIANHLNVSLDKINNWFQNRRAKTKQDLKKQQGARNIAQAYQSAQYNSEPKSSPYQPSGQYATMMQQLGDNAQPSNRLGISHVQQPQPPTDPELMHLIANSELMPQAMNEYVGQYQQLPADFYDSTQDLNRRTLTQENFNDMTRNGGMMNGQGQFENLQAGFSGDHDLMSQVFGEMSQNDFKQDVAFPYQVGAPLSSIDSSVPSIVSDQSYSMSMNGSAGGGDASVAGSDWTDSRSSSLSMLQQDSMANMSTSHSQMPRSSSQWQPGQSVPVDVGKQYEEFRQAAQGRLRENQTFEQPLAFPSDGAYARRDSQASMLAHSMNNVNIQTPQPNQGGVFKAPAPPANIAARRQRPKPANLGIAALRSASYSGAGQPGSPSQGLPVNHLGQDQHIRRIRSAAVMNGGVAHGRIMKSTPGSAQRSPVNWNFAQSMVSPHLAQNMSQGNLAPPTPMSPYDLTQQEQMLYNNQNNIQSNTYAAPQPSISETDFDLNFGEMPYQPSASVPAQNATSPPHTPSFYDQHFQSRRVGSHVITENTPPQSAPAGQSCFPSNIWAKASQPMHQQMSYQPASTAQPAQSYAVQQPQQPAHNLTADQQTQGPTVTFARGRQSNVTTGPPPGVPLQFANGVPTLTAEGTVKMSFPPQAQLMQQQSQQMSTPPQQQYSFVASSSGSPNVQVTAAQPRNDFSFHEYSPPESLKRASVPRRPTDTTPKNYTFTNHGPTDFEGKRAKKTSDGREGTNSCSPASSSGTACTA
ncbi:uncharacterized protein LTR77_006994 [Saxophila tyrrhenica]|uniref:Homeobox domain-containing protein n=1 Tax=Saxophila tyrrhenica TaxID=1690608 RepID=A0AAV9P6T4_9PEZI|nr:hypothetical protein LTR77_006994 [Saxophila tyrrhenica]